MRSIATTILALVMLAGCGNESPGPGVDAASDSSGDAASGVVCSAPLIAPCDMQTLTSHSACPSTPPEEATDCALTPQQACYYCTGAEASWTSQWQRPVAFCDNGKWAYTQVACGSSP